MVNGTASDLPAIYLPTNFGLVAIAIVIAGILAAACGSTQPVTPKPVDSGDSMDTTLGPGDVFDIRVYDEKELTDTFKVASDGTIEYPLLGTGVVGRLTPTEVTKLLEQLLIEGNFLKKPHVSVLVKEYNSKKVSIFGQVKKPGTFPYQEGMSVVEAISLSGGFTSMARANDTTVTRIVNGEEKQFTVPVEAIGQGKASNFILRPGDILFVPERVF